MAARKSLTTRTIERDTVYESLTRELVPYLRQTGALVEQVAPQTAPTIAGSRGGATVAVLTALLTALDAAGVINNQTTP